MMPDKWNGQWFGDWGGAWFGEEAGGIIPESAPAPDEIDNDFGWVDIRDLILSKSRMMVPTPPPAVLGRVEQDTQAQDQITRVTMRQRVRTTMLSEAPAATSDLGVRTSMARRNKRTLAQLLALDRI